MVVFTESANVVETKKILWPLENHLAFISGDKFIDLEAVVTDNIWIEVGFYFSKRNWSL